MFISRKEKKEIIKRLDVLDELKKKVAISERQLEDVVELLRIMNDRLKVQKNTSK